MKKAFLLLVAVILLAGLAHAGPPGTTFKSTLDNTAKSLETLATAAGVSYKLRGSIDPRGAWITVSTYDAKWATGTSPVAGAAGVGHPFASGSSWEIKDAETVRAIRWINNVATDNSVINVTLTY